MDVGDLKIDAIKEKAFLHHLSKFKRLNNFEISNCDTLPKEIFEFKFVKLMRIYGVKHFPNGSYEKLQNLTKIEVYGINDKKGEMSSLPDDFGKLPTLKEFRANNNSFTEFPMALTKIIALESVIIANNKISNIPKEIGNLKFLTSLVLSTNPIKFLPKEIGLLKNLTRLRVEETLITTIPFELAQLKNLEYISVSNLISEEYIAEFKRKCVNSFLEIRVHKK